MANTTNISNLKYDTRNARRHTPRGVGQIERSIQRDGFGRSILLSNDDTIIAGNATIEAATSAGLAKVRVIETDGSEIIAVKRTDIVSGSPEFTALAVADNRSAEFSDFDPDILQALIDEDLIEPDEFWFPEELEELMAGDGEPVAGQTDPDDVPEPPTEPTTKRGDLWQLGRHRLLCGDSTVVTDVDRLMDGKKADMVFTDPPYGMNLDTDYSEIKGSAKAKIQGKGGRSYPRVIGDDGDFDPAFLIEYFRDVPEQFWWGADYYADKITDRNEGSWIVWDKRGSEEADKIVGSAFELCWSKAKHKRDIARIKWMGAFGYADARERVHPTQKPLALVEWFLQRWGKSGDTVADLFGGSGSTLIACEQTHRTAYLMELDPHYCDVIIRRWENFTGQTATLADETYGVKS